MTNESDALKKEVSFILLTFAHLGWCLRCEGEGLSHCVNGSIPFDLKCTGLSVCISPGSFSPPKTNFHSFSVGRTVNPC